jgi:hypothetical protein
MGGKAARAARLDHAQGGAADPSRRRGIRDIGSDSRPEAGRSRPEIGSHAKGVTNPSVPYGQADCRELL